MIRHLLLTVTLALLPLHALAQPPAGKKVALIIGINEYKHPKLRTLDYSEADARDLHGFLKAAGYEATLLTGKVATRDNIRQELGTVLAKCKDKSDMVVLAFAGHGMQFSKEKPTDPDDAYFCPVDAQPFSDKRETMVSLAGVYGELEKSFAGMKLLLVDACRDDPETSRKSRGGAGLTAEKVLVPTEGVAAFFSCRAGESAWEFKDLEHGVFFHHVLEGLKGKAANADRHVTLLTLVSYVTNQVPVTVKKRIDKPQQPNLVSHIFSDPVLVTLKDAPPPIIPPRVVVDKNVDADSNKNFRNIWLEMTIEERRKLISGEKATSPPGTSPATVVVTLPADAKLTINDQATPLTGTRREFLSPPLSMNVKYSYTLKAELMRNGKTLSVTKEVSVSSGNTTQASFTETELVGTGGKSK